MLGVVAIITLGINVNVFIIGQQFRVAWAQILSLGLDTPLTIYKHRGVKHQCGRVSKLAGEENTRQFVQASNIYFSYKFKTLKIG